MNPPSLALVVHVSHDRFSTPNLKPLVFIALVLSGNVYDSRNSVEFLSCREFEYE
jgi:hypothetical protein